MTVARFVPSLLPLSLLFTVGCEPKPRDCPEPVECPACPEPVECPEPEPEPKPEDEPLAAAFSLMSVDPETKQLVGAKVIALETVEDAKVPVVNIDGLAVSADHPLVAEDRLIMAGRLRPGDSVYKLAGDGVGDAVELVPIGSVEIPRAEPAAATLYALDVDGSNTYFARETLAHEKAY